MNPIHGYKHPIPPVISGKWSNWFINTKIYRPNLSCKTSIENKKLPSSSNNARGREFPHVVPPQFIDTSQHQTQKVLSYFLHCNGCDSRIQLFPRMVSPISSKMCSIHFVYVLSPTAHSLTTSCTYSFFSKLMYF